VKREMGGPPAAAERPNEVRPFAHEPEK